MMSLRLLLILFIPACGFSQSASVCVSADCSTVIKIWQDSSSLRSVAVSLDGIKQYRWKQMSGPSAAAIGDTAASVTTVSKLNTIGRYIFQITATTNKNATASALDTLDVLANLPPVSTIAPVPNITLPTNTITLDGTKSVDSDGTIKNYTGVGTGIINPVSALTQATGLVAGVYKYSLVVTDDGGTSSTSSINVTVTASAKTIIKITQTIFYSDGTSLTQTF